MEKEYVDQFLDFQLGIWNKMNEDNGGMLDTLPFKDLVEILMRKLYPELIELLNLIGLKEQVRIDGLIANKITKGDKLKALKKEAKKIEKILNFEPIQITIVQKLDKTVFEGLEMDRKKWNSLKPFVPKGEPMLQEFEDLTSGFMTIVEKGDSLSDEVKQNYLKIIKSLKDSFEGKIPSYELITGSVNILQPMLVPPGFIMLQMGLLDEIKEFHEKIESGGLIDTSISEKDKLRAVIEHLSFLKEKNKDGEKIMFDSDYEKLILKTNYLVLNNELPEFEKQFDPIGIPDKQIRAAYYKIYKAVYDKGVVADSFVQFLHKAFSGFRGSIENTKKKFSEKYP